MCQKRYPTKKSHQTLPYCTTLSPTFLALLVSILSKQADIIGLIFGSGQHMIFLRHWPCPFYFYLLFTLVCIFLLWLCLFLKSMSIIQVIKNIYRHVYGHVSIAPSFNSNCINKNCACLSNINNFRHILCVIYMYQKSAHASLYFMFFCDWGIITILILFFSTYHI